MRSAVIPAPQPRIRAAAARPISFSGAARPSSESAPRALPSLETVAMRTPDRGQPPVSPTRCDESWLLSVVSQHDGVLGWQGVRGTCTETAVVAHTQERARAGGGGGGCCWTTARWCPLTPPKKPTRKTSLPQRGGSESGPFILPPPRGSRS